MNYLKLKQIEKSDMSRLWKIGFSENNPDWKRWDAPFLDDYHPFPDLESFIHSKLALRLMGNSVKGIYLNDKIIGIVTRLWYSNEWQIGICIYQPTLRKNGFGKQALIMWMDEIQSIYPNLEHLNLITWSRNTAMIKTAEKLGFRLQENKPSFYSYKGEDYARLKYRKDYNHH